jgi:hypothetical protein
MRNPSWTEDARFDRQRRRLAHASHADPQRHEQRESGDPFEHVESSASHSLEPGWLLGASFPPPTDAPEPEGAARTLRQRAAELGARLRDAERRTTARWWAPRYPLAGTHYLAGLPAEESGRLGRAFRDATPPGEWSSRTAALNHLQSLLPAWPIRDVSHMRGVHVFLGAAGAGKTTLVLKAAHRLTRAGRRVGLITLFPQSPERIAAFRDAALRVPAPVQLAHHERQLEEAVTGLARCDTILVDTPCLLSQPARSRQIARLRLLKHPSTVLHYSLCLHHSRAFQHREMAAATAHGVDFLALSHLDLAPGPGALIAVQLRTLRRISLANAYPDVNDPLVPFGAAALLSAFGRSRRD